MCKHTKCCLNNSKDRENIIIYTESLIMWIFPQGADISKAVQGQGCCFFLKGTLNTCHCQTSCNLGLQTKRPPKKKRQWWEHSTDILIACFFEAGPICIKFPLTAASHWTGGDPAISEEFQSDTFRKHIAACYLERCFQTSELHKVQQSKLTLLWQQLVSFIQIWCNWLHPGGTPGSNILIKLICEILTMWVFRWLVIWCERSLCFHWEDTGGAGTCFSKTLQKIIAVELSWVWAITNDSVCLSPHETWFFHHLFVFFSSAFGDGLSNNFFPQSSSFVNNLLRMIHSSHRLDYDNMCFWVYELVSSALASNQLFFSSCISGKYMYINSIFYDSTCWNYFWNMMHSLTFPVSHK